MGYALVLLLLLLLFWLQVLDAVTTIATTCSATAQRMCATRSTDGTHAALAVLGISSLT